MSAHEGVPFGCFLKVSVSRAWGSDFFDTVASRAGQSIYFDCGASARRPPSQPDGQLRGDSARHPPGQQAELASLPDSSLLSHGVKKDALSPKKLDF